MSRVYIATFFFFLILKSVSGQQCDPSSGCFGPNLVVDGDFESFNPIVPFTHFSNNYPYNGVCVLNQNNCGGFLCQGEFAVEQTPFPCNPGFSSNIVDHTFADGTGHMMIVDFSNNQSTSIWCQTVTLSPNTEYCFGAWFINLLPSGSNSPPPVFRFEINGNVLGISNSIPENEQWQFEGMTFNSGAGGPTELCIFNHNFGAIGFDLGIDDISVKEVLTGSPPLPQTDFVDICNNDQPAVIDVLGNDLAGGAALDFSTLSISSAPPFTAGTISGVDPVNGTVTFIPEGNFSSTTFFYEICDLNGCCAAGEVQVTRNPEILTSWTATEATCDDPQSGSIELNVSGGTPPFTFDWDNAPDIQSPSGLSTGTYIVTITDGSGCEITTQAFVGGPPPITASVNSQNATCNGADDASVEVVVNGGTMPFTYDWDNLADQQIVQNVASGNYTVTVSDGNGCEATASTTVTEPPVLSVSSNEDAPESCPGQNDGSGTVSFSGGTMPYSILWSNGVTTATANGLSNDIYTIEITDANGCIATTDLNISLASNLDVSVNGTDAICFGVNDGTATATPSNGAAPFTYLWSNMATTATITGLSPGEYFLTISDAQGCEATNNYEVNELMPITADIESTPVTCLGDDNGTAEVTVQTGTSPFTFLWDSGATDNLVTGLPGGTYYVTISDSMGCSRQDSVFVDEAVVALSIDITGFDPSCSGVSDGRVIAVPSGGTPGYSFEWNTGGTVDSLTMLPGGDYFLTVTDQTGCQVVESTTLTEPGSLSFEFSSTPITCFEGADGMIAVDTVTGGNMPYVYSIDGENFQTSETFSGLTAGNYSVFVEDINGCRTSETVSLSQPPPIFVQIGEDITLELGDSIQLSNSLAGIPGISYQWSPDIFLSCSDCPRPVVFPFETTTYQIMVTDTDGCTATDDITIEVDKIFDVFIPNAFSPNDDGINDVFMVFGSKSVAFINRMVIFDRWGEQVFEAANFQPGNSLFGWDGTLKGRKLSPGVFVYYVEVIFLDGTVLPLKGDLTLLR